MYKTNTNKKTITYRKKAASSVPTAVGERVGKYFRAIFFSNIKGARLEWIKELSSNIVSFDNKGIMEECWGLQELKESQTTRRVQQK